MSTRTFDLGDVLSITTGKLVSPRHIDGVYDILGHMTGEKLMTHQLPRAADQCLPHLLEQHPDLKDVDAPAGLNSESAVLSWLDEMKRVYGTTRQVLSVPTEDPPDPVEELCDMVGPERVWVIPRRDAQA